MLTEYREHGTLRQSARLHTQCKLALALIVAEDYRFDRLAYRGIKLWRHPALVNDFWDVNESPSGRLLERHEEAEMAMLGDNRPDSRSRRVTFLRFFPRGFIDFQTSLHFRAAGPLEPAASIVSYPFAAYSDAGRAFSALGSQAMAVFWR